MSFETQKNKNLPSPLAATLPSSRYYLEARGKRSTIVTARVTRRAEILALTYSVASNFLCKIFENFQIFITLTQNIDRLYSILLSQTNFPETPLSKNYFQYMQIGMS